MRGGDQIPPKIIVLVSRGTFHQLFVSLFLPPPSRHQRTSFANFFALLPATWKRKTRSGERKANGEEGKKEGRRGGPKQTHFFLHLSSCGTARRQSRCVSSYLFFLSPLSLRTDDDDCCCCDGDQKETVADTKGKRLFRR